MFGLRRKPAPRVEPTVAAPDVKGLAAPSDDLYALFGLVPTAAGGVVITAETALRVPAVGAAIRLIAEAAATLDVAIKRVDVDGVETPVPGHPALPFLTREANDWTDGFSLIRDLVIDALSDDRGGVVHVNRGGDGRVVELVRYRRGIVDVQFDEATSEPTFRIDGQVRPARDFALLRSPFGRSPLTIYREAIGTALALEAHAATLFGNGARPSGALSFPKGMGESSVRAARAAWKLTHEGGNGQGQTAILYDGATFQPFTLASTDAQFLENRQFQVIEVARAFRVPPTMLYDLARATWSNTEQMGREFLSYSLEPWLRALEGALGRALLTPEERATGHVVRFDRDDITRADLDTRSTVINSLIASRVLSPNEGRSWLGMPPRVGGDEFLNPNITAGTSETPPADPPEGADGP